MAMNPRGRLFRKYLALVMALVTAVLLISGGLEIYFSYREKQQTLAEIQREKAYAAALRIEQFITGIVQQITWINEAQWGSRALPNADRRVEYLRLLRQAPAITEVSRLSAQGIEEMRVSRLALDEVDSRRDLSGDRRFIQAKAGEKYFGPVYFRKDTEPYMTIAIAGVGADAGVTVTEVNLKLIWDVVSQIRFGTAGLAYVVDQEGNLIAHPDISLVLQKNNLSAYAQVLAARAAKPAEAAIVSENLRGQRVLATYAPIAPVNWFVFAEQPLSEAYLPLYAALGRTVGLLVLGFVLAAMAATAFARRMVKPILAIRDGATKIGAGQLGHRIEVKTGDELEALAEEFNHMAGELQESYAGLERKVEERTRELEDANRHKSEFLANMSHELRTPLNAIIGFSEALKARFFGELNAKQAEYVDDIHGSGRHLLALINDILDLAKVEAGRMELQVAPFQVPAALDQALTFVRERAHRADVRIELDVAPEVGEFAGDERKFRQIVLNLLSNAIKFTPSGGRVDVRARRANSALEVAVSDTGAGIAAEDQALIFDAFRQAGDKKQEGTGLGLTLTRKFAELHGGTLSVASEPGKGATFTVSLPIPS